MPLAALFVSPCATMLFKRHQRSNQATSSGEIVYGQGGDGSSDGSLKYVGEAGGNDAPTTYQEAGGAPVESHSPLGYTVGPVTILFLNISMMIGTGVYSTRGLPRTTIERMASIILIWCF